MRLRQGTLTDVELRGCELSPTQTDLSRGVGDLLLHFSVDVDIKYVESRYKVKRRMAFVPFLGARYDLPIPF